MSSSAGAEAPPSVSIILPTYERASLIGRSIRSVLEQTYRDFELIVVDDASTDATADEVARFDDPRIRYVRLESNRGAGAARNAGTDQAAGRFFAFQDSDDEWVPTKLECQMRAFAECDADVGVVYSDMERIFRNGVIQYHQSPQVLPGILIDPSTQFYQVCSLGIQATVIRQECFAAVGGFNEEFPALEDLELFVRLSQRYRFHHLPTALVRYYETDGISKNMTAKAVARRLLLELYRKDLEQGDAEFIAREESLLRAAVTRRHG